MYCILLVLSYFCFWWGLYTPNSSTTPFLIFFYRLIILFKCQIRISQQSYIHSLNINLYHSSHSIHKFKYTSSLMQLVYLFLQFQKLTIIHRNVLLIQLLQILKILWVHVLVVCQQLNIQIQIYILIISMQLLAHIFQLLSIFVAKILDLLVKLSSNILLLNIVFFHQQFVVLLGKWVSLTK